MKLFFLLPLCFIWISCSNTAPTTLKNEILWDTWGVPHIYADSDKELYKMMGWSQMRNHGDLLLKLYGEARGRANEYWEGDLEKDVMLHRLGLIQAADVSYANLSGAELEMVDAFVEGINSFADRYPETLDENYKVVLPVSGADVVAHAFRVLYFEFLINLNLRPAQKWDPGSNAWAINKSKTASGNSMLLANPHLPWMDFWLFYEAQFITASNNLYGVTLVGLPSIGIGFNENLGWTHTVNTLDNVDLFQLNLKEGRYELDGEWVPFEVDSVLVKENIEGQLEERWIQRKQSAFGTILNEKNDHALAVKWPDMQDGADTFGQWKAMGEAQNMEEFNQALEQNAIPLFNVIYADKQRNILYHFGGMVPEKKGDWARWQGILPSASSDDIWTEYYSKNQLPSYVNPESGWIQNANDPPYTSTIPGALDPEDYASHIAPNRMSFRPQRSARLIKDTQGLSLEEFALLKHDTKSEIALRIKDNLAMLITDNQDSITREALTMLTEWDGSFENNSQQAVFFQRLMGNLNIYQVFEEKWSFSDPLETPDGFRDPDQVRKIVKQTADEQLEEFGSLKVAFGDVYRLKVGDYEFPGNGGPGQLGIFRTVAYSPIKDGKSYAYHGDSFVCVMEFGEEVKAKALLTYGNATQSGNPHIGDQLELFSKKQLREVWLTRQQHEENLEMVEKLEEM